MSAFVPKLHRDQFELFFSHVREEYISILEARYRQNSNPVRRNNYNQERIYIGSHLEILDSSPIKNTILDMIQQKEKYREIIITINTNNDKYNLLIKMFSNVIDKLIINGKLIEYSKNDNNNLLKKFNIKNI